MRRLILRLAVFLLPLLIVWANLEWITARLPDSYSIKRRRLNAMSQEVDTLILGSSSAYYGIVPKQLSGSAFNLADVSQSLYYDDRLLTQVLPHLPRLKMVIFPITYISLEYELYGGIEDWRQYYYEQEDGIPPAVLADWFDIRMVSRVALRTPAFYKGWGYLVLSSLVRGRGLPKVPEDSMDDRGWAPADPDLRDPSRLDAGVTLARHRALMKAAHERANLGYLNHMASLLRERHIEGVFVTLPVWRTYLAGMDPDEWNRTQTVVHQLAKANGMRYVSFLNLPAFGPDCFFDPDHLSPPGAIRFTRLLEGELLQSNLRPPG